MNTHPKNLSPQPLVKVTIDHLIRLRHLGKSLQFPPRRRVSAFMAGQYQSVQRGRGIDFDEVRRYQAGDDIRSMDWRVTARTGHPHTKVFHEEKERPVHILVDYRSTMLFGTRRTFKFVLAAELAALFAWSARHHGDRVGGMIFNNREHTELKPVAGDRGVLHLFNRLDSFQPRFDDLDAPQENTFSTALKRAQSVIHPGHALIIISDFNNFNDDNENLMIQIARRADVTAIEVFDPLEQKAPPPGVYPVSDGIRNIQWNTLSKTSRQKYEDLYKRHEARIERTCQQNRIMHARCRTADSPEEILSLFSRRKTPSHTPVMEAWR